MLSTFIIHIENNIILLFNSTWLFPCQSMCYVILLLLPLFIFATSIRPYMVFYSFKS
uniref:Uncharacterized protein n=1 Tax=Arundo donax TaxID=35708 RepID=A0A0A9GXS4_ARUDO